LGEILFMAHSGVRYLVLLAGLIAAVLAAASLRRGTLTRAGEVAGQAFVATIDVQVVLGLGVVFTRPFYGALIGHIVMMAAAATVAHAVWARVKRQPAGARPARLMLAGAVGALALIVAAILAIGRPIV
jgi:hypothetical protein